MIYWMITYLVRHFLFLWWSTLAHWCTVLFYYVQMLNPYVVIQVVEKSVLIAAAALPMFLALAPLAVWVVTRSVDNTLRLLRQPSLWAAVMNSVIWVLFAFIAAKRVECMELILAYPILLTLNFTYLLMVYGYHKKLWMVYNNLYVYSNILFCHYAFPNVSFSFIFWLKSAILSLLVLTCLGYVFYAIKFESVLPMSWETMLGMVGLVILLFSHGCLMDDIKASTFWIPHSCLSCCCEDWMKTVCLCSS